MRGTVKKAYELLESTPNAFMLQQFYNPANTQMAKRENCIVAIVTVVITPTELGTFDTQEEAAKAYDKATRMYCRAKTKLNFPMSNEDNLENDPVATVTVVVTPIEVRYKGVRERPRGKYGDDITNPIQKVRVWLVTYAMKEEATNTFEKAARMYYYPKAKLNFPTSNEDNLENPNINNKNLHHELNLELILAPPGSK
ncbi:ethylene-responsive transcription factor CRF6-like [Solanum tuberosum]|nr:PREDICTED: ethylene-responsive transcription factor CRF6-like [Solanum tuberosum]